MKQRYWVLIALLAIIIFTVLLRVRLADVPLERDEGEYAYAGQLILQGIPPYELLYNMKLPGIYLAYAGILALFGQTHTGIHLGLLLINSLTIVLVFLLAKRVFDPLAGVVAAACFALLSIGQPVQGVFANAEHFVILPAVGGLLLLLYALDEDRPWLLFGSGLLLGSGLLMKQHGAAFVILGGLYILVEQMRVRPVSCFRLAANSALFILGAGVPYGLTCLILARAGVFGKFWFWTVDYAMAYATQIPLELAWSGFVDRAASIAGSAPLIWALAGLGLTAGLWDARARRRSLFVIMFAVFSFAAICPSFHFRPHYFVLTLPAAAILAGVALSAASSKLSHSRSHIIRYGLPLLLVALCLGTSAYQQRRYLFEMTALQVCRSTFGQNPFPESLEISRFIRANTIEGDQIAVIGSEPQIYFYSGRHSATGHVYMYALMEGHDFALSMQEEMIREIEAARPSFLVYVKIPTSWLQGPDSHKRVLEWFHSYRREHYTLVGLVDFFSDATIYHWSPDLIWPPRSPYWVAILERNDPS